MDTLTLALLAVSWLLMLWAVVFRAGLWGLHLFPRRSPRWLPILLLVGAMFLLGWTCATSDLRAWLGAATVSLPLALGLLPVLALIVRRRPEHSLLSDGRFEVGSLTLHGHEDAGALRIGPRGLDPKTVVVLVHGGGNDRLFGMWCLVERLVAHGHGVITAHLPGHGRGGQDGFSLAVCRDRLDALVDLAASRASRVVLLGQSLGGALVLDLLARGRRVDRVVSISAPTELDLDRRVLNPHVLKEMGALFRPAIYRALCHGNPYEVLPAFRAFKRSRFPVRVESGRHYLRVFASAVAEMDLLQRLQDCSGVDCPVLIVQGCRDRATPVEQARSLHQVLGQQATLKLFERVTHLDPLLDREVVQAIEKFIEMSISPT